METSFWLWACFYSPCVCFLLLPDQARVTRTPSKKPFSPVPHVVIPQIFMVRPLPTGFLLPTGALSLNLTWQTLTLKVSMKPGPGACPGCGGWQASATLSFAWALHFCSGFWAGRLHQPQELRSMLQGARLMLCSHWCRVPRSQKFAFLWGRRGYLSLSWL